MQRTSSLLTVVLLLFLGFLPQARASSENWTRIHDPEIGVSVDYPEGIFQNDKGATDRYPGKRYASSDGQAEFAYYAFDNKRRETPSRYLNRTLVMEPRQLIYRRTTNKFFVISSIRNQRIFYSRCNFGQKVKCIYLEYPASEKRKWDRAVTRISYSLSGP
jgi:hypothetical protein